MNEIFRDIEGYEGSYQVSNLGNIKSLNYKNKNIEHLLSQGINQFGYKFVVLYKDNKQKNFRVHRLVASAFIPNPNNYKIVNHKDGDKQNNSYDNLEWCTYSENLIHAYHTGLMKPHFINNGKNKKKVKCIETGVIYESVIEASKNTGFHFNNISQCCIGKQKQTHGFHFCFVN